MDADVCVIGAGPAGTSAAIHLAKGGHSVILVDKARFPRDKCCGDGLTALATRELERIGELPDHLPSWRNINDVVVASAHQSKLRLRLGSTPHVAIQRRAELDSHLLEAAVASGAELFDESSVRSISSRRKTTQVTTSQGSRINVRFVVAADGAYSLGGVEVGECDT